MLLSDVWTRVQAGWRWLGVRSAYMRGAQYTYWGHWTHNAHYYERAIDSFTHALELDPRFAPAYYRRGILYWREMRNAYRSIRDLTHVMELAPELAEAWFNRAQAHQIRGDFDLAVADLERYLAFGAGKSWRISAETQVALLRELQAEKLAVRASRSK
jgi:tetratricopeptide (TPR) repeat protein